MRRILRSNIIDHKPCAVFAVVWSWSFTHIDGLVQDCSNSSALAMELLQSCTKPSISFRFSLLGLRLSRCQENQQKHIEKSSNGNSPQKTAHIIKQTKTKQTYYSYVIMSAIVSQINSLTIVYSTVYSGADKKKSSNLHHWLWAGNTPVTGEFPTKKGQ